ncbi:MAG: surface lipoprotein assembly modifier [Sphingomicrobium sp.]
MILAFLGALAAQPAASAGPPAPPCDGAAECVTATPEQLFALADTLFADGDKAAAAEILRALTQDKHPELRAEARFRLAAVLESMNDLAGSAAVLRELLAEQPEANRARLELARILERMGDVKGAGKEIQRAEAIGFPPEVAVNVRRFASRLAQSPKRRGLTLELTTGPDTNINRSTTSPFIDTIIAPFELSEDARRIAGFGTTGIARFHSRDPIGPVALLTRVNGRADLYDKARFNDVQLSADSGPEFGIGKIRVRPSAIVERRWYGGDLYAKGLGGDVSLLAPLSARSQVELRVSRVRQDILPNRGQDGWRTAFDASFTQVLGPRTTGQLSLRHARLDARFEPESVRLWGGSALIAHEARAATLFGEIAFASAKGVEPLFLFGEERRDRRWDLTVGAIFAKVLPGGLRPLVRVTHSDSRADIVLWDFRRTRLNIGLTRSF